MKKIIPSLKNRLGNEKGFTLVELIGVLAIISILISAIAPNIVREISRATATAEDSELTAVTDALMRVAQDRHIIPDTTIGQWDVLAADYLAIPADRVLNNKGVGSRRLISRPTNDLGGNPYDQAAAFNDGLLPEGTLPADITPPRQVRMLLVSNLDTVVSATTLNNADFDAVWNQTSGAIPAGFTESEKLRIARINFSSLFYPVTMSCTSIADAPKWALDNETEKALSATSIFTVYLMAGTRITLIAGGVSVAMLAVNKTLGLTYDGSWSF